MPRRLAARRPTAHYATLAVLFVVAVAYQLRALEYRFPRWFRVSHVAWPFLLDAEDQPHFFLQYVRPNAQQAGLRDGDTLLAVNGRPVTGRAVLADALATARQGDVMKVMTLSKGTGTGLAERTVSVRLVSPTEPDSPVGVLLIVIMPALCLALGFWVAAVRPRDVRAWLLLALMLSLASFFNSFPEFWGPKARLLGTLYYSFQQNSWLGWLFLLGVYFPEPFPAGARWRWWKWLQWVALPAWMVLVTAYVAAAVGELHSVAAVIRINRFIGRMHGPEVILGACLVGGFLACTVAKYRLAPSADSKRRLRVLYAGAGVSLLPLTVLSTIAQLHHVSPEQYFPLWLMIVAYVCFSLLPVTLAYVIVVQRAMDVRLVIRQGLKYSVAKNTVNALKTALAAVIGAGLYYSIYDWSRGRNSLFPYLTLAIGVALFAGLNPLLESLGAWTDRRFFRDAYNAEQILGELAEKVRTIVETESLLETVTQRIADALHVPRLAVLLDGSAPYQPAYALGFGNLPDVAFPEGGATVQALKKEKQPLRIYFDDPNSWVYHSSEVSDSEREMLMHLRAELLLPFAVKDRLIGFMSLGPKLSEAPYSGSDVRLLTSVATQAALALRSPG